MQFTIYQVSYTNIHICTYIWVCVCATLATTIYAVIEKKDINGSDKLRLTRQSHVSARRAKKGHTKVEMASRAEPALAPSLSARVAPSLSRQSAGLLSLSLALFRHSNSPTFSFFYSLLVWVFLSEIILSVRTLKFACDIRVASRSISPSSVPLPLAHALCQIFPIFPLFFYFFIILILFRWPGNSWNLLLPIGLTSPCAPTNIFTYIQTSIYSSFQYCIFLCACIRFSANCPSTNWLLTDQFCIFWHIRHAPFCICNRLRVFHP